MMNFKKEWNEYVIGFILTFDDGRSINVQFEKNRASNHPQPDMIAVIGAEGDETIDKFNEKEQEEIRQIISADDDIIAVEKAITKIFYNFENVNLYEMSLNDIFSLAEKVND